MHITTSQESWIDIAPYDIAWKVRLIESVVAPWNRPVMSPINQRRFPEKTHNAVCLYYCHYVFYCSQVAVREPRDHDFEVNVIMYFLLEYLPPALHARENFPLNSTNSVDGVWVVCFAFHLNLLYFYFESPTNNISSNFCFVHLPIPCCIYLQILTNAITIKWLVYP